MYEDPSNAVPIMNYVLWGLGAIIAVLISAWTVYFVPEKEVRIIQRMGRFSRIAKSGINFKVPLLEWVAGAMSLKIQQLDEEIETTTKDNVFVTLDVSVQYAVVEPKAREAFYELEDPEAQIKSYIFDAVRGHVPQMELDDVFCKKTEIAGAVKDELSLAMADFGYTIVAALVTDIMPDQKVMDAMNDINAARRQRQAAEEQGEADKIIKVKQAEADAESMRLQGEGIAKLREAIVNGVKASVDELKTSIPEASGEEVMSMLLLVQYMDTLKALGETGKLTTIMLPHSPGAIAGFKEEMIAAMMATRSPREEKKPKSG